MEHGDFTRSIPDFHRVETPEQARLLSDPATTRYLEPFLGRERSASEAAAELGVRIDTLLYRIGKFLAAGLLEIVREEPRAGRAIKVYRTVADAFYVPFGLTDFVEHEEQLREQLRDGEDEILAAAARMLRQTGEEGRRIYRMADGEIFYQSAGDEGKAMEWGEFEKMHAIPGPAFETFGSSLQLTDEESKDFLIELYEAYERFRERATANEASGRGRAFLFRFQLAARSDG
jgi:hypothetical protein